ncbi:MAG TPA: tRNA (adenosine(37)-N6)-threonylcarbamoyltransferase complex dimerization subunit type 1 TsaB [Candidatus Cloacimonetes bacterium]|nr:tRNA (adenosine(37)-N6)-threonylcarbamoyltransferase complex dimerization subunit type 1 TsaB [Candidatus Cloacimonadota bacterium]HEX38176.1 tRNA (adenosine(37)-N6)-threonylcarbamoyltransferase complex dimerization subunit type 1 TsaB [Candidatus Cloacimonadota bacterium]
MNILAFETSTIYESIALAREGKIYAEYTLKTSKTHSEHLLPTVDTLLSEVAMQRSELDAIAFSIGPGSFTGLRIGLATAKGLCMGLSKPLYIVSTLKSLANNCSYSDTPICSVINAGRNELYAAIFTSNLEIVSPPSLYSAKQLSNNLSEKTLIVGNIDSRTKAIIEKKNLTSFARDVDCYPRASSLIDLVEKGQMDKVYTMDQLALVEPVYIRKSAAEEKFKNQI